MGRCAISLHRHTHHPADMHRAGDPRGYRALRRGRCSEPGRIYLLTTETRDRAPIFSDWPVAFAASCRFADVDTWAVSRLLCWVLMPDHWHGLLQLGESASLADCMQWARGHTAHAVNQALSRSGGIWMPGFHDRALRRDDDLLSVTRYIVNNPVMAGLVARAADYPYRDAGWLPGRCRG